MKYPTSQFNELVSAVRELSKFIDVTAIHPCQLHFIVYQQGSEGQRHNWFYTKNGEVRRAHKIENLDGWKKAIDVPETFELYPNGCIDSNIETAVKKALNHL